MDAVIPPNHAPSPYDPMKYDPNIPAVVAIPTSPTNLSLTPLKDLPLPQEQGGDVYLLVKDFVRIPIEKDSLPFAIAQVKIKSPEETLTQNAQGSFMLSAASQVGFQGVKVLGGLSGILFGGAAGTVAVGGKRACQAALAATDIMHNALKGFGYIGIAVPLAIIGGILGGMAGLLSKNSTMLEGAASGAYNMGNFGMYLSDGITLIPAIGVGVFAGINGFLFGCIEGFFKGMFFGAEAGYSIPDQGIQLVCTGFLNRILKESDLTDEENLKISLSF